MKKRTTRRHPGLNRRPVDLQSTALPLSYISHACLYWRCLALSTLGPGVQLGMPAELQLFGLFWCSSVATKQARSWMVQTGHTS